MIREHGRRAAPRAVLARAAWWALALSAVWVFAWPAARAEAPAPASAPGGPSRSGDDRGPRASQSKRSERAQRKKPKRATKKKHRGTRGVRKLDTPWHAPPQEGDCEGLAGAPLGSWGLMSLGAKECIVVPPLQEGPPAEETLAEVRRAFVDKRGGRTHDVDLRLLRVLQRAVRHFDVPYVHLISGFRPGRTASRHAHGLAADVVFPGVTNRELARFMQEQGFMGVGIYMRTGFVHVDVRERSYFWLDWSPPGKKWRGKPVRLAEAREADAAAVERGDAPFEAPDGLRDAVDARRARRAKAQAAKARRRAEAKRKAAARKKAAARREAERKRRAHAAHEHDRAPREAHN